MSAGMVSTVTPRIVINECVQRQVSREKLMAEIGISYDCIREGSSLPPLEKMYTLWESALSLTKDDMLGLHVAEEIPFGSFRLLDLNATRNIDLRCTVWRKGNRPSRITRVRTDAA
ncbi:MAG TPA: AraC family transcriptional regulator ligand-binding domain-containing protein [Candidatus Angelobacter sp.]|jgi:hypothetical protein